MKLKERIVEALRRRGRAVGGDGRIRPTLSEIAESIGCSFAYVNKLAGKSGLRINKRHIALARLKNPNVETIICLRKDGATFGQIAKRFSLTRQRIHQIVAEASR